MGAQETLYGNCAGPGNLAYCEGTRKFYLSDCRGLMKFHSKLPFGDVELKQTVSYFFSKRIGLFGICTKLKFRVCNYVELLACPHTARQGELLQRRKGSWED